MVQDGVNRSYQNKISKILIYCKFNWLLIFATNQLINL